MLGDVVYTNLNAVAITLNSVDGPYPITGWDDPIDQRLDLNEKSFQDGVWPAYDYDGHMEITIEGDILADDSDDYNDKRNALIDCLRYKPTPRDRRTGLLTVTFDGTSESHKADVSISSLSAPRTGASPNFSSFRLVLVSFLPYYVGVISGDPYYNA